MNLIAKLPLEKRERYFAIKKQWRLEGSISEEDFQFVRAIEKIQLSRHVVSYNSGNAHGQISTLNLKRP